MGLASDMKNLSEELLASFKQRIKENEELVNDVQKTLDGFRKDHQEMANLLNSNAKALRKGLEQGEKERLGAFNQMMTGIHETISAIQNEVASIQKATFNMITQFSDDRVKMAEELNTFFAGNKAQRMADEKVRLAEFDSMMNAINAEIKDINQEVSDILANTNAMIATFEKEHQEMSAELRAELSKNLAERVEYTRSLLNGFQKRLAQISRENLQTAKKLRSDLAAGETTRLNNYTGLMKNIHASIRDIQKEVKNIKKSTSGMIGNLTKDRAQASVEWSKMQEAMTQIRKKGHGAKPKQPEGKAEIREVKQAAQSAPVIPPASADPKTLDQKVLEYITKHPLGVKISEMEEPLGETRMKLGYTAKALLDQGKVQKVDNIYYPVK